MIVVADLVHKKVGDNPHLWYDPANMEAAARSLSAALVLGDPAGKAGYDQRLQAFTDSLKLLEAKVAAMRPKYAGIQVTATESMFGYLATALGLKKRNEQFLMSVMNSTEPRASDVAAFAGDLRKHPVCVFIYNSRASDPVTKLLRDTD